MFWLNVVSVISCYCMVLGDHKVLRRFCLPGCDVGGRPVSSVSKHHNASIFRVKRSMQNGHAQTKTLMKDRDLWEAQIDVPESTMPFLHMKHFVGL
jgi:hypothetical protein